jgi:polyhydroxyalkanoate synthase subunit PhaC
MDANITTTKIRELRRRGPDALLVHVLQSMTLLGAAKSRLLQQNHLAAMLRGLKEYQDSRFAPIARDHQIVGKSGSVRLLRLKSLSRKKRQPIILIPSLINSWEIFDLFPNQSFAQWLKGQDYDVHIIDWGMIQHDKDIKTVDDLLLKRLAPMIEDVAQKRGPVALAGYCMGGLLQAGVIPHVHEHVLAAIYLATPWDFHANKAKLTRLVQAWAPQGFKMLQRHGVMENAQLQALFALVDPSVAIRKYTNFASLKPRDPKRRLFVAVEDWLQSGQDLPGHLATTCLQNWYIENLTAQGKWKVGGRRITPRVLSAVPSLVVAPSRDQLVELATAQALYDQIGPKKCTLYIPDTGHIGMMVSPRAQVEVWQPIDSWLKAH